MALNVKKIIEKKINPMQTFCLVIMFIDFSSFIFLLINFKA